MKSEVTTQNHFFNTDGKHIKLSSLKTCTFYKIFKTLIPLLANTV